MCPVLLQLCKGVSAEEAERYCIPPDALQSFEYLTQSGCISIQGVDDAADFVQVKKAMTAVGILPDQHSQVRAPDAAMQLQWHSHAGCSFMSRFLYTC